MADDVFAVPDKNLEPCHNIEPDEPQYDTSVCQNCGWPTKRNTEGGFEHVRGASVATRAEDTLLCPSCHTSLSGENNKKFEKGANYLTCHNCHKGMSVDDNMNLQPDRRTAAAEGQEGNQTTTDSNGTCQCGDSSNHYDTGEVTICQNCGSIVGEDVPEKLYGDQDAIDDNFVEVDKNDDGLVTSAVMSAQNGWYSSDEVGWTPQDDQAMWPKGTQAGSMHFDTGDTNGGEGYLVAHPDGSWEHGTNSRNTYFPTQHGKAKDLQSAMQQGLTSYRGGSDGSYASSQTSSVDPEIALYGRRVTDDENNELLAELPEGHNWI